jgi:hypothetical protein
MLNKDCHHDCNQGNCPFAQDSKNANRYVCLKCGVEREINRYPSGFGSIVMLLLSLFIASQVLINLEKQDNQPQSEPAISSLR